MTELEKMQHAKNYMDKLANGIDPISGEEMGADDTLNNVRLSRCFFYVSDVLRRAIENGGEVGRRITVKREALQPFALPEELREKIEITKEPAMISHFGQRVNGLVNLELMRNLNVTAFSAWLMEKGFLVEETVNGKKRKKPSRAGESIGISSEFKEGPGGSYLAVYYNEEAQRFLVDNLDEIIKISNGEG